MADLDLMVFKLAAAEEIRGVKQQYARACDDGYDRDKLAEIFTEDAVWDGGSFGRHDGIKEICDFFEHVSEQVKFTKHFMLGHTVDVADDLATGTGECYMINPFATEDAVTWYAGHYRESYRHVDGRWRIERLELTLFEMPAIGPVGRETPENSR